ncbi:hypothetical protein NEOLEDRAFT_1245398, partial [Neolentinus lepideus HHB14362 ss-1]
MEEVRRQDEERQLKEERRRARYRGKKTNRDRKHEAPGQNIQRAIPVRSEKPDSGHHYQSMAHADLNDGSRPVAPRQAASPKRTQPPVSTPSAADADESILSVQQPFGSCEECSAAIVRKDGLPLSPLVIPATPLADVPCDDNHPELTGISPEMRPKVAEQDRVPESNVATDEQSQVFAIETTGDTVRSDSQSANVPETTDTRPSSTASCDGAQQTEPESVEVVHGSMPISIGMDYDALNEIYARAFAHVLALENEEASSDDEEDLTSRTSNLDIVPIEGIESGSYTLVSTAFPDGGDLRQKLEHDAKQFEIWNEIYARAFAQ